MNKKKNENSISGVDFHHEVVAGFHGRINRFSSERNTIGKCLHCQNQKQEKSILWLSKNNKQKGYDVKI
jgi:hypothetical protein